MTVAAVLDAQVELEQARKTADLSVSVKGAESEQWSRILAAET
jgi:hypothetical protein